MPIRFLIPVRTLWRLAGGGENLDAFLASADLTSHRAPLPVSPDQGRAGPLGEDEQDVREALPRPQPRGARADDRMVPRLRAGRRAETAPGPEGGRRRDSTPRPAATAGARWRCRSPGYGAFRPGPPG